MKAFQRDPLKHVAQKEPGSADSLSLRSV